MRTKTIPQMRRDAAERARRSRRDRRARGVPLTPVVDAAISEAMSIQLRRLGHAKGIRSPAAMAASMPIADVLKDALAILCAKRHEGEPAYDRDQCRRALAERLDPRGEAEAIAPAKSVTPCEGVTGASGRVRAHGVTRSPAR